MSARFSRLSVAVFASVLAASAASLATPARALDLPARALSYVVERDGDAIGSHQLTFQQQADGAVAVDIETHIAVKALFVTVYRFEHQAHEEWRQDQLVSLQTKTNDDGTDHQIQADESKGALQITADGSSHAMPEPIFPASLWNPAALSQGQLLNSLTGATMAVQITDLGSDTVTTFTGAQPARHYRISGDLQRDIWFNAQGQLAGVAFKAKDGSSIYYRLDHVTPL
jgi:hypothetical protein